MCVLFSFSSFLFFFLSLRALVYPGLGLVALCAVLEVCFPSQPRFGGAGNRNARTAAQGKFLSFGCVPAGSLS